ncbi:uncharacterized metal-binding lipoprotein CPn_0349/CP_0411/CPj0349/CpB0356 [Waddlia chondrophila 2032/99]|uniref:ABC-type transporter, substrate-binding lipoprotein n=2 Tax=Waddlia chondrophila TaxID=71667 RepID=D6YSH2_WADCW|nr:zinc ABC transporter substrate-binding protein [Waddlia chondrophila]ADI39017.1 ABC-type transporter, substrate-binding lipoprotein [Waddlia chondrophila WSU 86-1044]CCB92136.1 uncharacterized metal-binding lipoprotein CPn_0349/CP_0411/CPj0349/CpB0356 [Waddlia chondrophila 2032/99]
MKKIILLLLCLCLGCSTQPSELSIWLKPNGKIKILSTIGMIEDLVKQVGGDRVDTLTLVKGELDPHSYQLVKGDDEKLAYADIVFYNGLGLEHSPSLRQSLESHPKAYGLGDWILAHDPSLILTYNGTVDPHIWMDASLWAQTIIKIVEVLSENDPEHAKDYQSRGEALYRELIDAHFELQHLMQEVPSKKRYLVTSHDAFNYFARAYLAADREIEDGSWQKRFAAPEGLAPESQLSAADIRLILDHMKKYKIRVIFPESNVSRASIRKLKDAGNEEGLNLEIAPGPLYGDAMGPPGSSGDTYLKMLVHNVRLIAKYLNKNGEDNEG